MNQKASLRLKQEKSWITNQITQQVSHRADKYVHQIQLVTPYSMQTGLPVDSVALRPILPRNVDSDSPEL